MRQLQGSGKEARLFAGTRTSTLGSPAGANAVRWNTAGLCGTYAAGGRSDSEHDQWHTFVGTMKNGEFG